jgi:hypothetical protein
MSSRPALGPTQPPIRWLQSQSQSHITTDSLSGSLSWCRTPSGAYDQKLYVLNLESYSPIYVGALSDERLGLSFVIVSH